MTGVDCNLLVLLQRHCNMRLTRGLLVATVFFVALFGSIPASCANINQAAPRPNIILILADDLGWNDVGFHGSDEIPTPNIDALAYSGQILNQHYTLPLCTPSRAALLTGKYPIHTGMQHLVILEDEPWGLGLEERLLPQYLSKAGYKNHVIGKWHLGFFKKEYLPTFRGFDSHFGYWQGYKDYYNHSVKPEKIPIDGFDLHRGLEPAWEEMGKYTTDLFTEEAVKIIQEHPKDKPLFLYLSHLAPHTGNSRDPFQAPAETIAKFGHIKDFERKVYAAMVSKLDDSVGDVVEALREQNMIDNSVIIFLSDNGGQTYGVHANRGSNYPLRGMKTYHWEGGTRGVAAIWSPLLKKRNVVSNQLMHLVDWVPTLCSLAGIDRRELVGLDGVDMWTELSEGQPSPRTEILYNIDKIQYEYAAVRRGNWKYLIGTPLAVFNDWSGSAGRNLPNIKYSPNDVIQSKVAMSISGYLIRDAILNTIKKATSLNYIPASEESLSVAPINTNTIKRLRKEATIECGTNYPRQDKNQDDATGNTPCDPLDGNPCLFNLAKDPCERNNIANDFPEIVNQLKALLQTYYDSQVIPRNKPGELEVNPALWNNTYSPWHDEIIKKQKDIALDFTLFTLLISSVVMIGILASLLVAIVPRVFGQSNKIFFDQGDMGVIIKSLEAKDPKF